MINKPVTANDAVVKKILDTAEVSGGISYTDPSKNERYTYYPTVKVGAEDSGIQKILDTAEADGGVSYIKGNTRYSYTPSYNAPQSPSYTQTQEPYRDIAAEMDLAASMGEWDKFSSLASERMQKVAQNGGNDGGVTTNDLVNQLRAKYGKSYNNYQQMQRISDLLGGNISSPYDDLYQSLLQKYQDYTFDNFKNSAAYLSMRDLYETTGKKAMKNVLGEIAARTGGYASSYATAAAQEQYNDYMEQLAALAQQMYSGEKNSMQNDLQMLGNRADNYIQQQRANNVNVYNALRQLQQDQKAEEDAENQKVATAQQYARDAIINALSNGVDMELLDQGLLEQSGLSYMDLLAYAKIYSDKSAQQQFENDLKTSNNELNWAKYGLSASKAGRSSGGGGGSRRSSGGGRSGWNRTDYRRCAEPF